MRLVVPAGSCRLGVEGGADEFSQDGLVWSTEPLAEVPLTVDAGEVGHVTIDVPAPKPFTAAK